MPLTIALATAIAALAGAGASVGQAVYTDVNQPSQPKQPSPADITKNAVQQATQQRQGQAESAAQLLPNLQYDTGGGLSPDAYSQLSSTFSGNAGIGNSQQLQELVNKFLGTGNSGFGGPGGFGSTSPGLTGG